MVLFIRYIPIIVIVILTLTCKSLYDDNNKLKNSLGLEQANNESLKTKIEEQNSKFKKLSVDYDTRLSNYYRELTLQEKRLKGKPSDECEDIKNALDNVLNLNL